jgi:hypothetical protein
MDKMTECEKMRMFIDDNYAFEYMIWEDKILKQNNNDNTSLSFIDIDIVD